MPSEKNFFFSLRFIFTTISTTSFTLSYNNSSISANFNVWFSFNSFQTITLFNHNGSGPLKSFFAT
jgi:hypothetical protein